MLKLKAYFHFMSSLTFLTGIVRAEGARGPKSEFFRFLIIKSDSGGAGAL